MPELNMQTVQSAQLPTASQLPNSHTLRSASGSGAEDRFIELFAETFGAEKAGYLYSQYPFYDIYQNSRYADFVLENGARRIAIEIDDQASHDSRHVSEDKFADDLMRQNSMIHLGWDLYRWPVRQLQKQPETVKDELRVFLGSDPRFREIEDYLPNQLGSLLDFQGKSLELRDYQIEALAALEEMRSRRETIALLHHATGTGKTVTAISDAKRLGGRVLYIAQRNDLVYQTAKQFENLWPEASVGIFADGLRQTDTHIVCGSIQSVAINLEFFKDDDFDYLIVDEAHHAATETYQKLLSYFRPKFTLGLTATPERTDGADLLEIFRNTAHRLDIKTAVEIGALATVRCIRIHTNIDMTKVRFNSVQYNITELDKTICVTERNRLIVSTWMEYVRDRRTVVFCASVAHAEKIAELFQNEGVEALAVSGSMKTAERKEALAAFAEGRIKVLCACDLLNEGWDCPETEVLFMARPTMSKVLYTQQLGRGMRNAAGKDCLMVFDFVDIAGIYNAPYTLHRLTHTKDYRPGAAVLAPGWLREAEEGLYNKGEKPEAVLDYPVSALDYELVNIFNWQEEAEGMISQMELVRRVNVQSETIESYIRTGKLEPDLCVQMSEHRVFRYFKEETLRVAAEKYGWTLIDDSNRVEMFLDMVERMDMSYSYKPVFLKAFFAAAGGTDMPGGGEKRLKPWQVRLDDVVFYFTQYYERRKAAGKIVEKPASIYAKGGYTKKEAERNILSNPFKRFEDMAVMRHTKTIGVIELDSKIWKRLSSADISRILYICDDKLEKYYSRLESSKGD